MVAIPLTIWVVAFAVSVSWHTRLPNPIAVHFGPSGHADGFLRFGSQLAVWTGLMLILLAVFASVGLPRRRPIEVQRTAAGLGAGVAVFLASIYLISLAGQLDTATAAEADINVWLVLPAAAAGIVIGWLVSLIGRKAPSNAQLPSPPADAPRVVLKPTERAVWSRTQTMPLAAITVMLLAVVALIVIAVLSSAVATVPAAVIILAVVGLTGLWNVTVEEAGLRYRSILGWPRKYLPLNHIAAAEVVSVNPLKDAGGWGPRVNRQGQRGLYLRTGPAILVHTADGSAVIITIDDAHTAAGLLNSYLDRRHDALPVQLKN